MFYLKTRKGRNLYIEDDNVFTTCPICGTEFVVDIADIFRDGESDLYGTAVFCPDCARKHAADGRQVSA